MKKISALLKYLNKEGFLSEAIMAKRIVSIAQGDPVTITLTSLSEFFEDKNYVIALVEDGKTELSDYIILAEDKKPEFSDYIGNTTTETDPVKLEKELKDLTKEYEDDLYDYNNKHNGLGNLDKTLYENYFKKANQGNDAVSEDSTGVKIGPAGADPLEIAFVVLYDSTISSEGYDKEKPATPNPFSTFSTDAPTATQGAPATTLGIYGKPVGGTNAMVSSVQGSRGGVTHKGIDIIDDDGLGSDILSIDDGKVLCSYKSTSFGNTVIVYHKDLSAGDEATVSVYGHMETRSVVNGGDISEGDKLGTMGNTGSASDGVHLHLEVRKGPANILDLTGVKGEYNQNAVFSGSNFKPVSISHSDFTGVASN